jgi:hypothetical protein
MAATDRNRRILFNWDGSDVLAFLEDNPTPDRFIERAFSCIDGSQVDTLLYNFGSGNVAEYASDVLEWPGEADGFQFEDDSSRWRYENAKKLADMGCNPPKLISDACRHRNLEVFVSMRMNDIHDAFMPSERPTFKRENPQWLLPQLRDGFPGMHAVDVPGLERYKGWPGIKERRLATSLNYALPEVRQLKLDVIRELIENYDFDGIELDWSRHNNHFAPGTEWDNRHILTEFHREVRNIAEAAASKWGHPVLVFSRVPETMHGCSVGGYDVAAWMRDEIVDGLILGDMVINVSYLQQFRDISPRKTLLYPSVYGYGMGYSLWDDATIRGVAANMWMRGADGLATYNLYPMGNFRKKVLQQFGDPKTLEGTSKRYLSPQRSRMGYTRFSRHNCPAAPLPAYLNMPAPATQKPMVDHTVWCELDIADDIPALDEQGKVEKIELIVGLEDLHPEDRIFISLNGESLTKDIKDDVPANIETITWDLNADDADGSQPHDLINTHLEFPGLRFNPPAKLLRKGMNNVQVLLLQGNHRPSDEEHDLPPVLVTRVELLTAMKGDSK